MILYCMHHLHNFRDRNKLAWYPPADMVVCNISMENSRHENNRAGEKYKIQGLELGNELTNLSKVN